MSIPKLSAGVLVLIAVVGFGVFFIGRSVPSEQAAPIAIATTSSTAAATSTTIVESTTTATTEAVVGMGSSPDPFGAFPTFHDQLSEAGGVFLVVTEPSLGGVPLTLTGAVAEALWSSPAADNAPNVGDAVTVSLDTLNPEVIEALPATINPGDTAVIALANESQPLGVAIADL